MSTIIGILLFIFFVIVFFTVLMAGTIVKAVKNFRQSIQQAADQQQHRHRTETGRQRQQYSHRQQTQQAQQHQQTQQRQQHQQARPSNSGSETIIDNRRAERENKKIFDDTDGEYVDFVEEN